MRSVMFCLLTIAALLTSGCYSITYVTSAPPRNMPPIVDGHSNTLFGLIEVSEPVPVGRFCRTGFSSVHNEETFLDGALSVIPGIFGFFWNPTTVEVTCATGGAAPNQRVAPPRIRR